jgi:hypothetical protein
MAPADTLSPPGSASYSSDTMVVGDGTWDFTRNSFLLPNLVGLNFDTMRYNGNVLSTYKPTSGMEKHELTRWCDEQEWATASPP